MATREINMRRNHMPGFMHKVALATIRKGIVLPDQVFNTIRA